MCKLLDMDLTLKNLCGGLIMAYLGIAKENNNFVDNLLKYYTSYNINYKRVRFSTLLFSFI